MQRFPQAAVKFADKATLDEHGVYWLAVTVEYTVPRGSLVRMYDPDPNGGGIVFEALDGETVEVAWEEIVRIGSRRPGLQVVLPALA